MIFSEVQGKETAVVKLIKPTVLKFIDILKCVCVCMCV